ncbi:MAG: two-component regulator propeller domain-containing protein [Bacteroidales bacterium]|nr:two-component regulator propeller domain-containing protein [Bacteroidales bacterium]
MKTTVFSFLFSLFLLSGSLLSAQTFTNYTTSNGLPSDNVLCITTDNNSMTWVGTQNGVARFDGESWVTYTKENGLLDNYINCIAADKNNHIWAGTDYGVNVFDGTQWSSYTVADGLIDDMVTCLGAASDGSIWIGTNSGASHFNGSTWQNYTTGNGLPVNMISAIKSDSDGNIWFGTWLGGLAKFDGTTFITFTTADSLVDNNISAIAFDGNGNAWIGTYLGISELTKTGQWVANFRTSSVTLPLYVKDLSFDSKDVLWIGVYDDYTHAGGIIKKSDLTWTAFTAADGLVNNMVQKLAIDAEDIIWIATGSGVSRLKDQNSGIGSEAVDAITLFPNPVSSTLYLKGSRLPDEIILFDVTGKYMLRQTGETCNSKLDLSSLKPGLYFLSMVVNSVKITKKVMVQ